MNNLSLNFIFLRLCCWSVITFFSGLLCAWEGDKQLLEQLSEAERVYLKQHPVLRVQSEADYPPYNYAVNGKPSGFSIDFIMLVAEKLNISVQFEQHRSWGEYLQMLEHKQLDAMLNIMDNEERRRYADFTTDYAQTYIMTVTKEDNLQVVGSKAALADKRIVAVKNYAGVKAVKALLPNATFVLAENPLDALTIVASGRADVFFANGVMANYFINKYFVTGLAIQPVPEEIIFPRQYLRLATHKDNQLLLGILQKAINAVDEQQFLALRQKWFGNATIKPQVQLTNTQKIWLLKHHDLQIRWPTPGLPLGVSMSNEYKGIFAEFIEYIDNMLATEWTARGNELESSDFEKNSNHTAGIDLTIAHPQNPALQSFSFSQPLLTMPVVVLTANPSRVFVSDLNNLGEIKAGIVKDASYLAAVSSQYPNLKLTHYDNMVTAVLAVNSADVDVLLCPLAHCTYLINELGANNLRVVGQTPLVDSYSFAVSSEHEPLLDIINTVLAAMSPQRKNAIYRHWNSREEALVKTDYTIVRYLLAAVFVIGIFILLWNRKIAQYAKNVKLAHEALKQTQAKLVQAEKMASLGTLTAGVAHEINNPTNFVHVGVQNLEVDLQKVRQFFFELAGDNADAEIIDSFNQQFDPLFEHIYTIKDGTERIKTIVKDLRAFSRLDGSENKMADLRECLQSTINLVRTKYIEVTRIITDFESVPLIPCHPAQLNQVFMNLIVNACHAIMLKQKQLSSDFLGRIDIGCRQVSSDIVVTVADNGCGMSAQTKAKLFEPFYTTKAVGEGTGLGMAISFGIIDEHGGHIEVESELDKGTRITVRIPLSPDKRSYKTAMEPQG